METAILLSFPQFPFSPGPPPSLLFVPLVASCVLWSKETLNILIYNCTAKFSVLRYLQVSPNITQSLFCEMYIHCISMYQIYTIYTHTLYMVILNRFFFLTPNSGCHILLSKQVKDTPRWWYSEHFSFVQQFVLVVGSNEDRNQTC